ncbi:response regulator [Corallincola holothuriorum]|uniref:response regulator n=1 Tax=Corallincola holothuriorum TaxID=2282215 RepID=UPI001F44129C|nr:response regulator [Corallincola holothuriorum]
MIEGKKILLVEDDIALATWIVESLIENQLCVEHVARGDLVLSALSSFQPDLVILDVMLPGINGIEVCHQIRQTSAVPILFLTARADEFDEVLGLEAGADDYVIKPVRPRALLARLSALLKRVQPPAIDTTNLVYGALELDQCAKRVIYCGNEISLSTNLFDFLWFLARHAGEVVDRDRVFQNLKGREYDGMDRRFDVMLSTLRKLFNDDSQQPKKLKTVWGKGYLFVADAWQVESFPDEV